MLMSNQDFGVYKGTEDIKKVILGRMFISNTSALPHKDNGRVNRLLKSSNDRAFISNILLIGLLST